VSFRETNIGSVVGVRDSSNPPLLTSRGLRVALPVCNTEDGLQAYFYCRLRTKSKRLSDGQPMVLNLYRTTGENTYLRTSDALSFISNSSLASFEMQTIYIAQDMQYAATQMIPRSRWGHQYVAFELVFDQSCVNRLSYANSFPVLLESKWILFEGNMKAYAAAVLLREVFYTIRDFEITTDTSGQECQLHVGVHNDRPWCQFVSGQATFTQAGDMQKLLHSKPPPNIAYQDRTIRRLPSSDRTYVKAAVRRRPGGKIELFDRDICTIHMSIIKF